MHNQAHADILESSGYDIFFGNAGKLLACYLKQNKFTAFYFLTDVNTKQHCLPRLLTALPEVQPASVLTIPAGEDHKNIGTIQTIWSFLLQNHADRGALLVNVGGGVLTDMGAFAASTYKRGISFVQIPTTLLAQVDASVGGKTGIDFLGQKNMIGTFNQPKAVFIDACFLNTLDRRERVSGAAEMIKHGLVSDANFYTELSKNLESFLSTQMPIELVKHSVHIKNKIVKEDPFEKGKRKILNFGHTIGHALEAYSLKYDAAPLTHGEAIGMGMVCETHLSFLKAGLSKASLNSIAAFLALYYPPVKFAQMGIDIFPDLLILMQNDKKNDKGLINFTLLQDIGLAAVDYSCSPKEIYEALEYLRAY